MSNQNHYSKILIALPKPLYAKAGLIWQISGDLIHAGFNVDEVQFFHVLVPMLFSVEPYLVLVSTEIIDLGDVTNSDRATLIRAAKSFPKSMFIVWDKQNIWTPTDNSNPDNLKIWNDFETNEITQKILRLLAHSVN